MVPAARQLLRQVDLVPHTNALMEDAGVLAPRAPRSLDALHLASAISLGPDLTAFVVYDLRLVAAAQDLGLHVVRPGA